MVRVLFVCLGNICRSPTAEGVFTRLLRRAGLTKSIKVDSAGTLGFQLGHPPDQRAAMVARRRGYELVGLRSRHIQPDDFATFDLILAMDHDNLRRLREFCPARYAQKLHLLMDYADDPSLRGREVPDPVLGNTRDFEHVLDLLESGARGLLAELVEGARAER